MSYYIKKKKKKVKFNQIFQKLLIKKINLLIILYIITVSKYLNIM